MDWNDIPTPKPTPPGTWQHQECGGDYRAWTLRCGSLFFIHITGSGGKYYTMFNGGTLPVADKFEVARQRAEQEIVRRVRDMLPAYRTIHARLQTPKV